MINNMQLYRPDNLWKQPSKETPQTQASVLVYVRQRISQRIKKESKKESVSKSVNNIYYYVDFILTNLFSPRINEILL